VDCDPELYIYPAIQQSPACLSFADQYAFRPIGSTTAAIITILHKVTHLLVNNLYVIVVAIDYCKAFDTVRHSTLLAKMTQLDTPDGTYNWLVDFFSRHLHHAKYGEQTSMSKSISCSIIQGSAVGPASYVMDASDLHAVTDGSVLCKYADYTYLVIPAVNVDSCTAALHNVNERALANNLQLNLAKSPEIIFTERDKKTKYSMPNEIPLLQCVQTIKILGVTFASSLSVTLHVQNVIASCAQTHCASCTMGCATDHCTIFSVHLLLQNLRMCQVCGGLFANANDRQDSSFHHGLCGGASTVLMATDLVSWRWQFSTPHRIHTP